MTTASLTARVRAALDEVLDPCSAAAGVPAGLVTMGLVREIAVEDRAGGAHVRVLIGLTEPTCLMGYPFLDGAREALATLPDVLSCEVALARDADWNEGNADPEWRARLAAHRAERHRSLGTPAAEAGTR